MSALWGTYPWHVLMTFVIPQDGRIPVSSLHLHGGVWLWCGEGNCRDSSSVAGYACCAYGQSIDPGEGASPANAETPDTYAQGPACDANTQANAHIVAIAHTKPLAIAHTLSIHVHIAWTTEPKPESGKLTGHRSRCAGWHDRDTHRDRSDCPRWRFYRPCWNSGHVGRHIGPVATGVSPDRQNRYQRHSLPCGIPVRDFWFRSEALPRHQCLVGW